MAITGTIRGKTVELDHELNLPDGTRVTVIPESVDYDVEEDGFDLGKWLEETRKVRERLPLTSDSTEILRQMRIDRASR